MKKSLKILVGFIIVISIGVLGKTLYIANKIDKNMKIEKKIEEEKEIIENLFINFGEEVGMITVDENSSFAEKVNKLEEYDKTVYLKIKNSNLSEELKSYLTKNINKIIEMLKSVGYFNIYINEAVKTSDLSYIDLAEKKLNNIGNNKIKIQTKKYCNTLRKVIIAFKNDNLSQELYEEMLKDGEDLKKEFSGLSNEVLN